MKEGDVAIVTGASSGIGEAVTRKFARQGVTVIALARREERLHVLSREFENIEPFVCDVSNHVELERCVATTIGQHKKIDILVNNAGFSYYERHEESTLKHWRKTMEVNLDAYYVMAKLVVPHMVARNYGRIVNVSSVQSLAAEAMVGAYAAAKGAINAWSRSLAVDLAEHNIIVNVVAPGCIHTEMSVVKGVDETTTPEFQEWYVRRRKIPLARPGKPEEVANAVFFLSGDQCAYITGQVLVVDGGLTSTF